MLQSVGRGAWYQVTYLTITPVPRLSQLRRVSDKCNPEVAHIREEV